ILVAYWLVRAVHSKGSLRAATLCGLSSGLALYVYTSARFLAVGVAIVWLVAIVVASHKTRLLLGSAVSAAVACVTALPLALYVVGHPSEFFTRASQTSIFDPSQGPVLQNVVGALGVTFRMFAIDGEPGWDRDIAHQPLFDPVVGLLFFAGILIALRRWRQPAYILALGWLLIMLAPMTLTSPAWPDFGRAIGIVPVVFFFPAIAAAALWRRWPAVGWPLAAGALGLIAAGYWQYFGTWAHAEGTRASYRPEVVQAGKSAITRLSAKDAPGLVFFGAPEPYDAVTDFLVAGFDAEHPQLAWRLVAYNAKYTRVTPPPTTESYLIAPGRLAITIAPVPRTRTNIELADVLLVYG